MLIIQRIYFRKITDIKLYNLKARAFCPGFFYLNKWKQFKN